MWTELQATLSVEHGYQRRLTLVAKYADYKIKGENSVTKAT